MRITDNVVVLRDGELVAERPTADVSVPELIRLMVGRQIDELYPTPSREKGDVVLELHGLTRRGYFEDVSFSLRRGEILGFAGLVGAGRTELAEAMFGVHPAESGTMALDGLPYIARSRARPSGAAWRTSPKTGWRTASSRGCRYRST